MSGLVHEDLGTKGKRRRVGINIDLKRAYKQVPSMPTQQCLAVVCLWDPWRKCQAYFVLRVLPFGVHNAVFCFGSLARALEVILVVLFAVCLVQYVDGCPQVEVEGVAGSTAEEVLALLGWEVKRLDGEVPKFCLNFTPLGVVVNLEAVVRDALVIADKPERLAAVVEAVAAFLDAQLVDPIALESLCGKLLYTRAQCFGRCAADGCGEVPQAGC